MLSITHNSSDNPNVLSTRKIRMVWDDQKPWCSYDPNMPRKRNEAINEPATADWYLVEWMGSLDVSQAKLGRLTGWSKATCNDIYSGKTGYYRRILNQAAAALNVAPFELLLPPDEAMALRRLRDSAIRIAADTRDVYRAQPRDGTNG